MTRSLDLVGMRFGSLTVVRKLDERSKKGEVKWECQCDCGGVATPVTNGLTSGKSRSCGCYHRKRASEANLTHGQARVGKATAEFRIWMGIIKRCTSTKEQNSAYYIDKGVTVCDRWRNSFEAFFEDMGPRPSPKHSIDRIDPNGNYCPDNCRWATHKEQMNNTTRNRHVTIDGETKTFAQWCEFYGVPTSRTQARIDKLNWSPLKALTTPKLAKGGRPRKGSLAPE